MNLHKALKHNLSVIPVKADKTPACRWKEYQTRTPSKDEIAAWQRNRPHGWAIVTGRISKCIVLDFDGVEGRQTMRRLELEPHVQTPSGGFHVYVQHPGTPVRTLNHESTHTLNSAFPGMDIRADGGYAIFFGRNGKGEYHWIGSDEFLPFSSLPDNLQRLLRTGCPSPPAGRPQTGDEKREDSQDPLLQEALREAAEIGRNNALFRYACHLRQDGVSLQQALKRGEEFARLAPPANRKGNEGPMKRNEVYDTVRSAFNRPSTYPTATEPPEEGQIPAHKQTIRENFLGKLRWCPDRKSWYLWDTSRWRKAEEEEVRNRVYEKIREAYTLRYAQATGEEERRRHFQRLQEIQSGRYWREALELFKGEEGVLTHAASFDPDPFLLNTPSGVLDLQSGALLTHKPEQMMTRQTRAAYNPQEDCPEWRRFLSEILPAESAHYLQRAFGLALLGENRGQQAFILYGRGANGKSTLLNVLTEVLGDYAGAIPRDALLTRREQQDAARVSLTAIEGLRLGILDELADGATLSPVALKDLTSGNKLQARGLYENYREIRPLLTPVIATNHKPAVPEQTEGVWRRIRLIPFHVQIPPEQRNPDKQKQLLEEGDGILNWLVQGCLLALKDGLQEPEEVLQATATYRSEEDILGDFLDSRCVLLPHCTIVFADLYAAYAQYTQDNGSRPLTKKALSRSLEQRGIETGRIERRAGRIVRVCGGIGLAGEEERF